MDAFLDFLAQNYTPEFGFGAAIFLLAAACCLAAVTRGMGRGLTASTDARIVKLRHVLGAAAEPSQAQTLFADHFPEISQAMAEAGPKSAPLVSAWQEFRETFVDETATPIVNTARPGAYFARVTRDHAGALPFWSNMFVASGLILTFLGLIAALRTASLGMADMATAAAALTLLLKVSSAKFMTSVGGIGGSLILRSFEHERARGARKRCETLCDLLERGLQYQPPQMFAAKQVTLLETMSGELKTFNTDLAIQISERMGQQFVSALQPVAQSLDALNGNMAGLRENLGQSAADAVSSAASGELRALGHTLAELGQRLDGLGQAVSGSGDEAARQIRNAATDFKQAAEDIRAAFDRLAGDVEMMGARISTQAEGAGKAGADALALVLAETEAAQRRAAEQMGEALERLSAAGITTAERFRDDAGRALASGVRDVQANFTAAVDISAAGFARAGESLTEAVRAAAERVERVGAGLGSVGDQAARTADALRAIGAETGTVAVAMSGAAASFGEAARPVATAAEAARAAAERIAASVIDGRTSEAQALAELRQLAASLRETQDAAKDAWADYRRRFGEVDQALGKAAETLSATLDDSFKQYRSFASEVDSKFADAVAKLDGSVSAIQDSTGAIEEYADALRAHAAVPRPVGIAAE